MLTSNEFTNMTYYSKITESGTYSQGSGITLALTWGDVEYGEWTLNAAGVTYLMEFDMFEKRTIKSWLFRYTALVNGSLTFEVEHSLDGTAWTSLGTETLVSAGPRKWGDMVGGDVEARYIRFTATNTGINSGNAGFATIQVYV